MQFKLNFLNCALQNGSFMKQQILIGFTTSLILTGGLLSSSRATQVNVLPRGQATARLPQGFTLLANNAPQTDNTVKVGTPPAAAPVIPSIANIQLHEQGGREAATLYLKGIPVITFLGVQPIQNSGVKVSTPNSSIPGAVPAAPVVQATTLAGQLNQLHRDNFDARQIRVSWDAASKTYVISANQRNLLTLNENTLAPNASQDRSADALRIANLMRRQLGNAPALTAVEGRGPASDGQVVAVGPVRVQLTGHASWYGPGFHGRLTANGERFNQYAMTAAHRTLPFGTRMRVTNLSNGRSVVVRVNDRGPFIPGRHLDLSKGAAQVIGIMGSGTGQVRMEVLN
jgi:rare lipoprotein A